LNAAMPGSWRTDALRCAMTDSASSSSHCFRPPAYSWLQAGLPANSENRLLDDLGSWPVVTGHGRVECYSACTTMKINMDHHKLLLCAGIFATAPLLLGFGSNQPDDAATIESVRPEPIVPIDYQKIAPAPIDSSEQMLAQTATIFQGVLKDVQFTYDDCAGPRTNYVFSDSTTLAGVQVQPQVTLRVLGGPTPFGTWVRVSELPQLALDSQHVVFLRNTDWTFSPIVGNLVFRGEMIDGREVLIDPTGHAVTGWGDDGPLRSANSVSEAVGRQSRGYRDSKAAAPTPHSTSAEPDPNLDVTPAQGNAPDPAVSRTAGSAVAHAPSSAEIRKAGLFARPTPSAAAISNERTVSAESLMTAVRAAADRARVNIGGRLTLDPHWKCWSSTPTTKVAR
jgi:hypothetical protein